ncbi:hypothetical protein [Aromatoleum aromaticum]|uniref:hypothetical protein n=1 Tax=Aromatoleum aromaticum TaxID=551760 RepID=UPI0005A1C946|nr:hypothetical protein [Aromatoleum aromaticum]
MPRPAFFAPRSSGVFRPAADRQFALGLCHVLVNELYDAEFLEKDTNAPHLVGPDGYFVRNADGKIYVWDAADKCAKPWDDLNVKEFALEGRPPDAASLCRGAASGGSGLSRDRALSRRPRHTPDRTVSSSRHGAA